MTTCKLPLPCFAVFYVFYSLYIHEEIDIKSFKMVEKGNLLWDEIFSLNFLHDTKRRRRPLLSVVVVTLRLSSLWAVVCWFIYMLTLARECASLHQALFLCNICVFFRPLLAFGKLLFIHTSTNATDDHKYAPLPFADFDSSEVLVSFSAFIFL